MYLDPPNYALLACCAGGLGALAAVSGKIAGTLRTCPGVLGLVMPVIMWGLLLMCNGAMTALFIKSLTKLPSLQATVLSLSTNILATGLLGGLLFREHLTPSWFLGAACILCGVFLINKAVVIAPYASAPAKLKPE
ncbi:hypothetical protein CEUSTIGMA_g9981.t1 [Chlamydomonas eustigma]|uniref:EamA domain-containing protein n=1 Tax=Chlamydomonas eustigma TaxID=1157962 RepID=A0A250XHJ7_9CHLO|nr:hypothetical protein CEUSTIGMA_g9981.t1 [Chlamydomonas eustigma]|eukprot:GAX82555.1 hypothetical protein CEUSTIGMA_g9981.t1 [Chlamydomonas eustigma]